MFPHMVEEKVCGSGGRDRSDSGNEMCTFVTELTTTMTESCPADCGNCYGVRLYNVPECYSEIASNYSKRSDS